MNWMVRARGTLITILFPWIVSCVFLQLVHAHGWIGVVLFIILPLLWMLFHKSFYCVHVER
jgi:hypothetical protein